LSKQETCCQPEFGKPKASDLFLDLANASTHTNYLIQIVKEHLLSQKKSPCLTMTYSAQQRSGSLAVISTSLQALFKSFLSFFSAFEKQSRYLQSAPFTPGRHITHYC